MMMSKKSKLKCPKCGNEDTTVEDTVNKADKIERYRKCSNGHSFKTYETYKDYAKIINDIEWEIKRFKQ